MSAMSEEGNKQQAPNDFPCNAEKSSIRPKFISNFVIVAYEKTILDHGPTTG